MKVKETVSELQQNLPGETVEGASALLPPFDRQIQQHCSELYNSIDAVLSMNPSSAMNDVDGSSNGVLTMGFLQVLVAAIVISMQH